MPGRPRPASSAARQHDGRLRLGLPGRRLGPQREGTIELVAPKRIWRSRSGAMPALRRFARFGRDRVMLAGRSSFRRRRRAHSASLAAVGLAEPRMFEAGMGGIRPGGGGRRRRRIWWGSATRQPRREGCFAWRSDPQGRVRPNGRSPGRSARRSARSSSFYCGASVADLLTAIVTVTRRASAAVAGGFGSFAISDSPSEASGISLCGPTPADFSR